VNGTLSLLAWEWGIGTRCSLHLLHPIWGWVALQDGQEESGSPLTVADVLGTWLCGLRRHWAWHRGWNRSGGLDRVSPSQTCKERTVRGH
jgi:hypothetical protein